MSSTPSLTAPFVTELGVELHSSDVLPREQGVSQLSLPRGHAGLHPDRWYAQLHRRRGDRGRVNRRARILMGPHIRLLKGLQTTVPDEGMSQFDTESIFESW